MKGKIAFVLGAAAGYVLGSRAGRARYEQIKRGARAVWNTSPVQQGANAVRGVVDDRVSDVKFFIRRAASDAFSNLVGQQNSKSQSSAANTSAQAGSSQSSQSEKPGEQA